MTFLITLPRYRGSSLAKGCPESERYCAFIIQFKPTHNYDLKLGMSSQYSTLPFQLNDIFPFNFLLILFVLVFGPTFIEPNKAVAPHTKSE